jgi:hypothetical protein
MTYIVRTRTGLTKFKTSDRDKADANCNESIGEYIVLVFT